jgi:beta-lactamase class A
MSASRRAALAALLAAPLLALARPSPVRAAAAAPRPRDETSAALAAIERRVGGRLGVAVLAADGAWVTGHRADERFPLCSTFKLLLAAHVLARVDRGQESLQRIVRFERADLIEWSPVTERHLDEGLSVEALCAATMTISDNTAANLLLAASDGPDGLTRFLRGLGDPVTRLDRIEPALSEARPGDPRDTTSPRAVAATTRDLVLGDSLRPESRERLVRWLRDNRTGDARLRAGLAPGWIAGEKTGSGQHGTTNDVGVLWDPAGRPWFVAAYLTECAAAPAAREAALASVAAVVTGAGVA